MLCRMFGSSLLAIGLALTTVSGAANAQDLTEPIVSVTDIVVTSVVEEGGALVANAVVTLDVIGEEVKQNVQIPLALTGSPGEVCDILHLAVGPVHLDLLGLVVNLDDCDGGPIVLDIDAAAGEGILGDLLCGIAGDLLGGLNLGDILDDLSPTELTALTNAIEDILNELFDSILSAADDATAAQHKTKPRRSCDILSLDIPEGLTLELLGLVVDTSPICLDIHAERGPRNLLGTLLCNLLKALDGTGHGNSADAIARNILRLLDRLGL